MAERRRLSGEVAFAQPAAADRATVRVLVEDVSRADAPATVVAESHVALDEAAEAGRALSFALDVPVESEAQRLNVRVHVDHSGDGTIAAGDSITTQAHPVLTQGAPDHVEVVVHRV